MTAPFLYWIEASSSTTPSKLILPLSFSFTSSRN
nr:hypothetical protein Iba_chr02eCG7000 [Ipomoea batatas]